MGYRVYTSTEKKMGIGNRQNEDHYMFSEYKFMNDKKIQLLIVADGMGGLDDGEKASFDAVRGFLSSFYGKIVEVYMNHAYVDGFSLEYTMNEIEDVMVQAIQHANKVVCQGADLIKETGSTISAVCVLENYAVIANVGDSPVYFYRKNKGRLTLVSTLQTGAEQDVENGLYERYSPSYYDNEHKIYCSLGQYSNLSEENICISCVGQLQQGDIILMGSDGAFGRMFEDEILELIVDCPKEEEGFILGELFDRAILDKNDDQTAILYIVAEEEE